MRNLGPDNPKMVEVYHVKYHELEDYTYDLRAFLPEESRAQSKKFAGPKLQNAYQLRHGTLFRFLERYTGIPTEKLKLVRGERGKPELAASTNFHFNISHSKERIVYAFSYSGPIGVDVEAIDPNIELDKLMKRFFHPREAEGILELPNSLQVQAFFKCWSQKEAIIKAIGQGLSIPLDDFQVEVDPRKSDKLIFIKEKWTSRTNWYLHDLQSFDAYQTALATPHVDSEVIQYEGLPSDFI